MKTIVVNCEYNDPVDIRCGGPHVLGFDFYVNDNEVDEIKSFVKQKLHDYGTPLLDILVTNAPDNVTVWTKDMIDKCIKNGY